MKKLIRFGQKKKQRIKNMLDMYLAMALRDAPKWWSERFQSQVRRELAAIPKTRTTKFVGLDKAEPHVIKQTDINLAVDAQLMLMLSRFPSFGVGQEHQARIERGKPTLVLHPLEQPLSNMVIGSEHTTVMYYRSDKRDGTLQAKIIRGLVELYLQDWFGDADL